HAWHRFACQGQVYEVAAPQRLESLAALIFGDRPGAGQLRPLTEAAAAKLELMGWLPPRPRVPRPSRREPSLLLPYERVFHRSVQDSRDPRPRMADAGGARATVIASDAGV